MQLARMIALVAAASTLLVACGGPETANGPNATSGALKGDDALIAAAQKISDAIGGCAPADATAESKVVGLEAGAIVMIACSQGSAFSSHRIFIARASAAPRCRSRQRWHCRR